MSKYNLSSFLLLFIYADLSLRMDRLVSEAITNVFGHHLKKDHLGDCSWRPFTPDNMGWVTIWTNRVNLNRATCESCWQALSIYFARVVKSVCVANWTMWNLPVEKGVQVWGVSTLLVSLSCQCHMFIMCLFVSSLWSSQQSFHWWRWADQLTD